MEQDHGGARLGRLPAIGQDWLPGVSGEGISRLEIVREMGLQSFTSRDCRWILPGTEACWHETAGIVADEREDLF
jgi:hypothetical protein